jgi:hypothetical protein
MQGIVKVDDTLMSIGCIPDVLVLVTGVAVLSVVC